MASGNEVGIQVIFVWFDWKRTRDFTREGGVFNNSYHGGQRPVGSKPLVIHKKGVEC